jgi:Tfp pilus assembly protein PilN
MPVGAVIAVGVLVYVGLMLVALKNDTKSLVNQYNILQAQTIHLRSDIKQAQADILAQKTEADSLSADAAAIEGQIVQTQADQLVFTNLLSGLKLDLDNADRDVREVINLVPAGVNITGVGYQADSTNITGTASSQSLILTYARSIRSGGRFASVTISSMETLSDGTFSFVMVLR